MADQPGKQLADHNVVRNSTGKKTAGNGTLRRNHHPPGNQSNSSTAAGRSPRTTTRSGETDELPEESSWSQ